MFFKIEPDLLSSPGCDDNVVEKIVGSLNLIPVEKMSLPIKDVKFDLKKVSSQIRGFSELHLAELKVFNVVLLDKRLSCYIQHCKQPTPARWRNYIKATPSKMKIDANRFAKESSYLPLLF